MSGGESQAKPRCKEMADLVTALNALTPLGLAGGLAYVIYLLVKNQRKVHAIGANHLHELPQMAADIRAMRERMDSMNEHVVYIRARMNGK